MRHEQQAPTDAANRADNSPLRILVYDKDKTERWLIGTFLQQWLDRKIAAEETDQIADVKLAVDRGRVDLVVVDIDAPTESRYWLEKMVENQLAAVVVLAAAPPEGEVAQLVKDGRVGFLSKSNLSREELIQTIDGSMKQWQAVRRNLAHKEEIERLANCDPLTGLLNRRMVMRRLEEYIARARRYEESLAILILDIDHFKEANQVLGRTGADAALLRVATVLQKRCRDTDLKGRYGGDEFLLVFPRTNAEAAQVAGERIAKMIGMLEFKDAKGVAHSLTLSGGIAGYQAGDDVATMTYRAESCLCQAKDHGRKHIER
jgi:two-component system cell cycle response regulator